MCKRRPASYSPTFWVSIRSPLTACTWRFHKRLVPLYYHVVGITQVLRTIVSSLYLYIITENVIYYTYLLLYIGTRDGLSLFNVSPSARRRRYKFVQTIILRVYNNILGVVNPFVLYCFVEILFCILNWLHPRNKTPCARYVHYCIRLYIYIYIIIII